MNYLLHLAEKIPNLTNIFSNIQFYMRKNKIKKIIIENLMYKQLHVFINI